MYGYLINIHNEPPQELSKILADAYCGRFCSRIFTVSSITKDAEERIIRIPVSFITKDTNVQSIITLLYFCNRNPS